MSVDFIFSQSSGMHSGGGVITNDKDGVTYSLWFSSLASSRRL